MRREHAPVLVHVQPASHHWGSVTLPPRPAAASQRVAVQQRSWRMRLCSVLMLVCLVSVAVFELARRAGAAHSVVESVVVDTISTERVHKRKKTTTPRPARQPASSPSASVPSASPSASPILLSVQQALAAADAAWPTRAPAHRLSAAPPLEAVVSSPQLPRGNASACTCVLHDATLSASGPAPSRPGGTPTCTDAWCARRVSWGQVRTLCTAFRDDTRSTFVHVRDASGRLQLDVYGDDAFLCTCDRHSGSHALDAFLLPGHVWTRLKAAAYAIGHVAHSGDSKPVSSTLPDTHDVAHAAFAASPELLSAASGSSAADSYSILMTATPLMADGVMVILEARQVCGIAAALPVVISSAHDFDVAAQPGRYTHHSHAPQQARDVLRTLRGDDTFGIRAVSFMPMLSAKHIDGAPKHATIQLTGMTRHVLVRQPSPAPFAACKARNDSGHVVALFAPDGARYLHGSVRAWQLGSPALLHEITCGDALVWSEPRAFLAGIVDQLQSLRSVETMSILHDAQRMHEVSDAEYARRYYDVAALQAATLIGSADGVKAALLTPVTHAMLPHMIIAFNVYVDINGAVYTRDGSTGVVSSHLRTASCYPPPLKDAPVIGIPHTAEVFVMSHQWSANIWHWMGENLSRAYALTDFLRRNPQMLIFVTTYEPQWRADPPYSAAGLGQFSADAHVALLTLLGIDPGRLIKNAVHADVVYLPEGVPCSRPLPFGLWAARDVLRQHLSLPLQDTRHLLNAASMHRLRCISDVVLHGEQAVLLPLDANILELSRPLPPVLSPDQAARLRATLTKRSSIRVLVFVRSASEGRRMQNMAQLLQALRAEGYDVTTLDDAHMPPAVDVLRVTASFDVLIGAHGAGFTNSIVSSADTCVVEVLPDGQCGLHYMHMAGVLGHAHHSFVVPGGKLLDMTCNVPRVLEAVLSCTSGQRARRAALQVMLTS